MKKSSLDSFEPESMAMYPNTEKTTTKDNTIGAALLIFPHHMR